MLKSQKLKQLKIYLAVVCDVVAYRYLVKYYFNLFHRLNIMVEEYIDYKVERMYQTLKDKKERIEDIMSYVYMSFMLSSPRLIYDYGEKLGRCKLVKDNLPYFQVQRLKFFFIERENVTEHYIYNVDNLELDALQSSTGRNLHSNLEKYSLSKYKYKQSIVNSTSNSYDTIREYIANNKTIKFEKSKNYLLSIFDNWSDSVEGDYQEVKNMSEITDNFTLFDYIRYKYENKMTDLKNEEYLEVLSILNTLLKKGENSYV